MRFTVFFGSRTPRSSCAGVSSQSPGIAAAVLQGPVRLRRHHMSHGSLHHHRTTVCYATRTSLVRLDFDHLEWICTRRGRRQSSGGSPDPDGLGVGEWEPRGSCSDIITPSPIGVSSAITEPVQPICNVRAVSLLEVRAGWGRVKQNSKAFFQPLSPLPLLITLPSTQTSAPCLPHEHQTKTSFVTHWLFKVLCGHYCPQFPESIFPFVSMVFWGLILVAGAFTQC